MVSRAKEVAPKRFRESAGRYYEDFELGDVYEHRPGRTLTEADNTWFSLLTMNQHPLHIDAVYGAGTEFGRPLVNSALTLAIVTGMSVSDVSQKTVANLGWDKVRLTAPVSVAAEPYGPMSTAAPSLINCAYRAPARAASEPSSSMRSSRRRPSAPPAALTSSAHSRRPLR